MGRCTTAAKPAPTRFLDMIDKDDVFNIPTGVREALNVGGQVHILVPALGPGVADFLHECGMPICRQHPCLIHDVQRAPGVD
jgi:hypothetical protein